MLRTVIAFFVFIAVVCVGLAQDIGRFFAKPQEKAAVTTTAAARPVAQRSMPQPAATSSSGRTVTLQSDGRGHFQVDARIDGRRIDVLVDTGASAVVLRESSAAQLGIFPKASDYTGRTNTANGVAKYAPVRLNRVEINGITVRDVDAAVMADESLKTNLLGMTFLSRVKFTHDRGRLVLEQ